MDSQKTEFELQALYERQFEIYSILEEQTSLLPTRSVVGIEADTVMVEIGHSMEQVARIDDQVKQLRATWDAGGAMPGPELALTLKRLEGVIVRVMENIHQAEQKAASAKARLEPKMASEVQQRRMASAYAATASRH